MQPGENELGDMTDFPLKPGTDDGGVRALAADPLKERIALFLGRKIQSEKDDFITAGLKGGFSST